ncbi:RNA polymerase sigma-70 factor, ECF subfamily [Pedobacter sp. ok626]|uniref:RNA polymerase sigma-70 factor n=1 Tax=Pedobacter hiemivivus TaxID=2530454 RepID=A0A4R0MDM3_9SPHI|nr:MULTISPECIES: RNA polymerase sigma-70 factor [Pedobacter]TCC84481.1 RNA polymerase sigma-70 factor [Pedobacter hiemivivus]SDJ39172.1 RNA polymerase sigma-70 factor, ECF subfamily [Pedobacter sp. ok626]
MTVYSKLPDTELTTLLKDGDQHAFTEIYNRHWKLIYAHVYKMLRDEDDAKDVVQEVFGNLWLRAASIKSATNVSGLLYIAARNKVFDLIGKNKVRADYIGEIASFISDSSNAQVDTIDEKRILEILEREIQKLPPKMREIFELSRKDDLSHKEIATKLNISEQTVKKQVQNALKVIKPKLNDMGISIAFLLLLR